MYPDQEKILARTHSAIDALRSGGMVIMVDDEDRENEGDIVFAAECVTPQLINFMAKEARGLICLTLEPSLVDRLKLPMMSDTTKNIPYQGTAFTVSIEAREGVSTGISAADRAHTIKVAIGDDTSPNDIVVPGHIFPLKARAGGVLERAGHTEGSTDLAKLAGFKAAAVICEIMNDDGTMARMPDLEEFSKKHKIPIVAIADLIQYRLMHETMVEVVAREKMKTDFGTYDAILFRNMVDKRQHLALLKGGPFHDAVVDVRVQTQRPLLDLLSHRESSDGFRLRHCFEMLSKCEHSVFLYLQNPDASWDKDFAQLKASDKGQPEKTPEMRNFDLRMRGTGAQILRSLGVQKMRVHSTTPVTVKGISAFGLEVVDTVIIPNLQ